jgi:hypothetical protein
MSKPGMAPKRKERKISEYSSLRRSELFEFYRIELQLIRIKLIESYRIELQLIRIKLIESYRVEL